jgi:hypothetical protein
VSLLMRISLTLVLTVLTLVSAKLLHSQKAENESTGVSNVVESSNAFAGLNLPTYSSAACVATHAVAAPVICLPIDNTTVAYGLATKKTAEFLLIPDYANLAPWQFMAVLLDAIVGIVFAISAIGWAIARDRTERQFLRSCFHARNDGSEFVIKDSALPLAVRVRASVAAQSCPQATGKLRRLSRGSRYVRDPIQISRVPLLSFRQYTSADSTQL